MDLGLFTVSLNIIFGQMIDFKYKEIDQEGLEVLEAINVAKNFNHWMYKTIVSHCSGNILEIGSGIGNISTHFLENGHDIVLSDIRENYRSILADKFMAYQPQIIDLDMVHTDFDNHYRHLLNTFDTVYALNVVEHIEDDRGAIRNAKKLLRKGGKMIILVPAFNTLYNGIDRSLEHYRRYTIKTLTNIMSPELSIIHQRYFNFLGILGWVVMGGVFKRSDIKSNQTRVYEMLLPVAKGLDSIFKHFFGLSVIVVGVKE
jgi:2-polyprenyl-3-methyl-5-hydroxy-6-metoxy-1,4-benzoquinol methylase